MSQNVAVRASAIYRIAESVAMPVFPPPQARSSNRCEEAFWAAALGRRRVKLPGTGFVATAATERHTPGLR
jgi:hypothetical protein